MNDDQNTTTTAAATKGEARRRAAAWLARADVTPTGYRVGRYLVDRARSADATHRQRKARVGEIIAFPQQSTIAAGIGVSDRQVRRGVRSLKAAGLEIRRRARPYGATYVFPAVDRSGHGDRSGRSGVRSSGGRVLSHRDDPRTERTERTRTVLSTRHCRRVSEGNAERRPTKRQVDTILAMCRERGLFPRIPETRRRASEWITDHQRMGHRAFKRVIHVDAAPTELQAEIVHHLTRGQHTATTRWEAGAIIESRGLVVRKFGTHGGGRNIGGKTCARHLSFTRRENYIPRLSRAFRAS